MSAVKYERCGGGDDRDAHRQTPGHPRDAAFSAAF